MTSYAPLFSHVTGHGWEQNLIEFSPSRVMPSVNYEAERLFSANVGRFAYSCRIDGPRDDLFVSATGDGGSRRYVKLVNTGGERINVTLDIASGMQALGAGAQQGALFGDLAGGDGSAEAGRAVAAAGVAGGMGGTGASDGSAGSAADGIAAAHGLHVPDLKPIRVPLHPAGHALRVETLHADPHARNTLPYEGAGHDALQRTVRESRLPAGPARFALALEPYSITLVRLG